MLIALLVVLLVLAVLGPGYRLRLAVGRRSRPEPPSLPHWPDVDVIVPVHNEAPWLASKIENLKALDYPQDRARFWIVDGASDDGTPDLADALTEGDPRFRVLRVPVADKTHQLNAVWPRTWGRWVLVTDADAQLEPDALGKLVRHGEADPRTAVVGAVTRPQDALPVETLHWERLNALRQAESDLGFALVTGPCYLVRRDLFDRYPDDVVGDDIYATWVAAVRGRRAELVETVVTERRAPGTLSELLRHKTRKAKAYLREIFRFLPAAGRMPRPAHGLLLWRAGQLILAPALTLAAVGLFASLCITLPMGSWLAAGMGALCVLSALHGPTRLNLTLGVILVAVLFYALVTYRGRGRAKFFKVGHVPDSVPTGAVLSISRSGLARDTPS